MNPKQHLPRPASAVSTVTGWIGAAGLALALYLCKQQALAPTIAVAVVFTLTAIPMIVWELAIVKPWRCASSGLAPDLRPLRGFDRHRLISKLLGFAIALSMLAVWFYALPMYGKNYAWLFQTRFFIWVPVALLAASYVAWIDLRELEPNNGAWHTGQAILRHLPPNHTESTPIDWQTISEFLLGWFIKGFFFVFLINLLPGNIGFIQRETFDPFSNLFRFVFVLTTVLFTFDIALALVGYACTFRLLDAHIRSPNDQVLGWVAALSCYPPFILLGAIPQLDYRIGGVYWDQWLATYPTIKFIWALVVMGCLSVYVWATIAFGLRFSNLTNRGTLTHGPYRLFRHPAYVCKNIYWWLIYVPWINTGAASQALINCALLALLSLVYYWRAKTEEAHLIQDLDYQAYVQWFDQTPWWLRVFAR